MQFVAGSLGGLIGGLIALLAGYLAYRRDANARTVRHVLDQAAVLITGAGSIATVMQRVHERRHTDDPLAFDKSKLDEAERDYGRAYTQLSWLTSRCEIWPRMQDMDVQRVRLVETAHTNAAEWETRDHELLRARGMFDEVIQHLARMSPARAMLYIRGPVVPMPPPAAMGELPPRGWRRIRRAYRRWQIERIAG